MTVAELRELLAEVPDYYPVQLSATRPVEGVEQHAHEVRGAYVVVI